MVCLDGYCNLEESRTDRSRLVLIKIRTDQLDNLLAFRKAAFLGFRENQLTVDQNIEAVGLAIFELYFNSQSILDFIRQPGGCRSVRSGGAVPDHDTDASVRVRVLFPAITGGKQHNRCQYGESADQ